MYGAIARLYLEQVNSFTAVSASMGVTTLQSDHFCDHSRVTSQRLGRTFVPLLETYEM